MAAWSVELIILELAPGLMNESERMGRRICRATTNSNANAENWSLVAKNAGLSLEREEEVRMRNSPRFIPTIVHCVTGGHRVVL